VTKGQHYLLPLDAIVEAMKTSLRFVSLQAQLSSVPKPHERGLHAEVTVGQGRLSFLCYYNTYRAVPPPTKEAYTIIQQYGDLEWSLHTTTPSPCRRDHLHGK